MAGRHHNTRREEEHNPPPPQVHHTSHTSHSPAPPQVPSHSPAPPHVPSHSPAPPLVPSHSPAAAAPHHAPAASTHNELANKPSVRVYCKAEPNFSLTIRDGKVVLAHSNSADPLQHWIKDEKYSTRVKDKEGFPSFALVNKATGQAMKHSVGATQPVELSAYNSNKLDESILWTESKDLGDGYHTIRMVNNIQLNVDAFNGDKNHGGVHDGTRIVLWEWKKDSNQRWKIVPYCKFFSLVHQMRTGLCGVDCISLTLDV
ncbi:ricin B-like lectin R40G3 isoform X1 [Salvia miltiorrhiza]|uniref:ricin B-like lectin R40G3 isoform X1 n=2 Tax=Salvia miltiorrhiza TaxID=226208 RepID=UPI0025AD506E|nr:ricin B-like lectin R40G3 isoform X1 [Salvia miltiorrhiza]